MHQNLRPNNNDAQNTTKYGFLLWPDAQIVAVRTHCTQHAPFIGFCTKRVFWYKLGGLLVCTSYFGPISWYGVMVCCAVVGPPFYFFPSISACCSFCMCVGAVGGWHVQTEEKEWWGNWQQSVQCKLCINFLNLLLTSIAQRTLDMSCASQIGGCAHA